MMGSILMVMSAVAFIIAGCRGGGGGGGVGGGGAKTVLVRTYRRTQIASPNFIAFQDGNGQWQIAQGSGGQYTFTINDPNGRYGLAIVFVTHWPDGVTEVEVNILHATVSELSEINLVTEEFPAANLVTVSGTVSGLGIGEGAIIAMDMDDDEPSFSRNTYSLDVPPGTYDLVAVKGSLAQVGPIAVNKMLIQRNVIVPGNTTINVDFNDPNAFVPETRNAVIGGVLSGEYVNGFVRFLSHNKTEITVGERFGGSSFSFTPVPTNKQLENDIHYLNAIATTDTTIRLIERYFKAPMDISATLPSPFGNASVTVGVPPPPYTRFTASWDAYSGAQAYFARFISVTGRAVSWFVGLSAGWLGGQTSYTLPDLSGLSGWDNNWGFPSSGLVDWEVGAVKTNRPIQDYVNAKFVPTDGLEVSIAGKRGRSTITP